MPEVVPQITQINADEGKKVGREEQRSEVGEQEFGPLREGLGEGGIKQCYRVRTFTEIRWRNGAVVARYHVFARPTKLIPRKDITTVAQTTS
jgi:hypothetical protein